GGILCRYSDPLIINTVISSNSANRGGGIFFTGSDPSVANVAISGNSGEYGGGIFCLNSSPFLTNAILWYNVADEGPQIYGDSPQITYSDIQGGWEGQGNIDVAPLFRDATGGDFHIMSIACGDSSDSPCIDAGDPAVSDSLLDCSWGLGTTDSDMGAFGGGGSMTGIDEVNPDVSRRLALSRNYPNPFNVSTSLEYNLPEASYLTIDIYNILGQRVETVFEGEKPAGNHVITWDASAFPSGVYFARLKTKRHPQTIRLVLLK
ncbi:MAG: T9SS type A sorting domain-containing protein, partial [candidate division Zixibacteria bacterium]